MTRNYFAQNLRALRLSRGYTQQQMSDLLHIRRQSYCNYENNQRTPSLDTVILLAEYFEITVDELLRCPLYLEFQNE